MSPPATNQNPFESAKKQIFPFRLASAHVRQANGPVKPNGIFSSRLLVSFSASSYWQPFIRSFIRETTSQLDELESWGAKLVELWSSLTTRDAGLLSRQLSRPSVNWAPVMSSSLNWEREWRSKQNQKLRARQIFGPHAKGAIESELIWASHWRHQRV